MQFEIGQAELASAVTLAGQSVSSKSTLPVLGNLLLTADRVDGSVTVTGTNLETALALTVPAEVEGDGAITLPARLLRDALAGIPNDARLTVELQMRTMSANLTWTVGGRKRGEVNIKGIDAAEFPLVPTVDGVDGVEFTGSDLGQLIRRSAFAAADGKDTSRPALTGVRVGADGRHLLLAATDGYRLAVARQEREGLELPALIVSARALELAGKLAAEAETAALALNNKVAQLRYSGSGGRAWWSAKLTVQTIDAKFPDYTAIMPKGWDTVATVDAAELGRALKLALLFARDNSARVRLTVKPGLAPDLCQLNVAAESAEAGHFATDLDAVVEGPGLEIVFNGGYLQHGLAALNEPTARLEFTRSDRPCLLRGTGYEYVVMPMQLR